MDSPPVCLRCYLMNGHTLPRSFAAWYLLLVFWSFTSYASAHEMPLSVFSRLGAKVDNCDKSWIAIPSLPDPITTGTNVSFEFETWSPNGIIFLAHAPIKHKKNADYLAIYLEKGNIHIKARCGLLDLSEVFTARQYDNSNWHTIRIVRTNGVGEVFIDHHSPFGHYRGYECDALSTLWLGGSRRKYVDALGLKKDFRHLLKRSKRKRQGRFVGCIRNLKILPQDHEKLKNTKVIYQRVSTCFESAFGFR